MVAKHASRYPVCVAVPCIRRALCLATNTQHLRTVTKRALAALEKLPRRHLKRARANGMQVILCRYSSTSPSTYCKGVVISKMRHSSTLGTQVDQRIRGQGALAFSVSTPLPTLSGIPNLLSSYAIVFWANISFNTSLSQASSDRKANTHTPLFDDFVVPPIFSVASWCCKTESLNEKMMLLLIERGGG
ncbi:hypothetical protein M011DRAFT_16749 [Sporormia fimetaria CBS 119925]|uniref:Uncharacterized protein n=1 Tax=Sporormia fimetaria CBS 119925 TaxID=1340428 RepID=A0A6A6VQL7_9PLEO|nr:hypothetical protein M011DRAFT_16749 [Sporormia fimetaria CBS 119925]